MSRAAKLVGYLGGDDERPRQVEVTAIISGSGMRETLTLECKGSYRVTVPYRPLERLAHEAVQISLQEKQAEQGIRLEGLDGNRRQGTVVAYLRASGRFLMLSLDFMGMGQISAPFAPIEKLVREERGRYA
ncbi:MAG: hypothetical protein FWE32_03885 [Oscillospiraceae bacterium]|nr:hypothetical protein [Oscillospiraceae bacterium]